MKIILIILIGFLSINIFAEILTYDKVLKNLKGTKFYKKEEFDQAKEEFNENAIKNPNDGRLQYNLGNSQYKKGYNYELASRFLQRQQNQQQQQQQNKDDKNKDQEKKEQKQNQDNQDKKEQQEQKQEQQKSEEQKKKEQQMKQEQAKKDEKKKDAEKMLKALLQKEKEEMKKEKAKMNVDKTKKGKFW